MIKNPAKFERIIYQFLSAAWRQRRVVMIPLLLFPLLGLAVGIIVPKKYESTISILIQEPARINPFLEDLSIATNLKERINSLNALLHSQHVLLQVLHDFGSIKKDSSDEYIRRKLDKLSRSVSSRLIGKELIELSIRTKNPERIQEKLEIVSKRFIERIFEPAWASLNSSEVFLTKELESNRATLDVAEKALANFRSAHSEELPELHTRNVGRLIDTQEMLAEKRGSYAGARAALDSLQARLIHTNPVIGKLEEQIVKSMGELALLKSRYTENHSKVQGHMRMVSRLQQERNRMLLDGANQQKLVDIEQLWNVASTMFSNQNGQQPLLVSQMMNLEEIRSKMLSLEHEIKVLEETEVGLRQKVSNYGMIEQEMNVLVRNAAVKREVYEGMLNRKEMAHITGNLGRFEVPNRVKIIDKPSMPPKVITPKLWVFMLAGLVGGLMMGIGLAVMFETADNTVRYPQQLIELTGHPVLFRVEAQTNDLELDIKQMLA